MFYQSIYVLDDIAIHTFKTAKLYIVEDGDTNTGLSAVSVERKQCHINVAGYLHPNKVLYHIKITEILFSILWIRVDIET